MSIEICIGLPFRGWVAWAKPVCIPIEQQHRLALAEERFLDDPERY